MEKRISRRENRQDLEEKMAGDAGKGEKKQ